MGLQHAGTPHVLNWETRLTTLSLAGQAIAYLLGIVVARRLGVEGFEAYVVASAAFILMVTFVPMGLEKYSLRLLPPLVERGEWGRWRAYAGYSIRRILAASVLVGVLVGGWALLAPGFTPDARTALLISCLSLPAGALVHLALELLTGLGKPFAAALVFRVVVPALVLTLVCVAILAEPTLPAPWAIAAWGLSWCVALALMAWRIRRALPPGFETLSRDRSTTGSREWVSSARPFWFYRVWLAVLAQAGVLALERLQPSASAVGAFAAAAATASIAQVLATSTNRVYASRLSVLLERRDFRTIAKERDARLRWLGVPLLAYLVLAWVFARPLVALFRPEFADEGALALRLLACGTALSIYFSVAPTYLKHSGQGHQLYRHVAIGALVQLGLLGWLVPRFGATGAATASLIATVVIYGNLARLARRELTALEASEARAP